MVHINQSASPYGAGWELSGQQRLIETGSGNVILLDGNGTVFEFESPETQGNPYTSPSGDFSTFEKLGNNTFRRTMKDQTVYQFDSANRLATVTDRNNNVMKHVYDAQSRLLRIIDPVGLETRFTYVGARLEKITDPADRVTLFEYDGSGNLTKIIDPDGSARTFGYDARHRMISEIDKRENLEQTFYGFHGRAERSIRGDGSIIHVEPAGVEGLYPESLTLDPGSAPSAIFLGSPRAFYADASGNVESVELDAFGAACYG